MGRRKRAKSGDPTAHPRLPRTAWVRLLVGLVVIYALFHAAATVLGSHRGEAGVFVGILVVTAALGAERLLFGVPLAAAATALGLGRPLARGLFAAAGVCLVLLIVFPVFAAVSGKALTLRAGWAWFLPGLFAQAGVAEETLFRGFLFRHVRAGRSFWRAVAVSSAPFVAVHLVLLTTMPWPIALAAVLLATALSAPLAHLFELGGGTIWAPVLVNFTVQGAIKLVAAEGADAMLPLVWMAASATLPWLAFLIPRRPD